MTGAMALAEVRSWPLADIDDPRKCPLFGGKADMNFCASLFSQTILLFSRHPLGCICAGCDLAPNDVNVTAQVIELVREC